MNPIPETAYKFGCGRYVQESGAMRKLPQELSRLGCKAFVLSGTNAWAAVGPSLEETLRGAGFSYAAKRYDGAACEESAVSLAEEVRSASCDIVLSVGGGRVLDTGKMVAHYASARCAALPTSTATCSAFTPLSVVYTPKGATITSWFFSREVDAVVVDTAILAKQPPRCAAAGMVDSMAKWLEIRHHAPRIAEDKRPADLFVANALADAIYQRLYEIGPTAYRDICDRKETETVAELAYLTIPATGMVSGSARGARQSALAHLFYERARACFPRELFHVLHGELVGLGLTVQLLFSGQTDELDRLRAFMRGMHMPETLGEIGLPFTRERLLTLHGDMARHEMVTGQPDGPIRLFAALEALVCA